MRETAKTLDEAFNQMRVQMDFIVQSQMRQEKMLKKLYDDSNNNNIVVCLDCKHMFTHLSSQNE